MLTRHLSDEELSEIILDSDRQHLRQTLGALPEWAHAAAEHPEVFWERQRAAIRTRIADTPEGSSARIVTGWAGAFALVLLAIFLLHTSPAPRPSRAQTDPDQELLVAVEQTVQNGVPQALEPAAMLADEISGNNQPVPIPSRFQGESK
jgi:hypothetical protein